MEIVEIVEIVEVVVVVVEMKTNSGESMPAVGLEIPPTFSFSLF